MHTDATQTAPINKKIETVTEYTHKPFSLFGGSVTHAFFTRLTAYSDTAMSATETVDRYEILIFDFDLGDGAITSSPSISNTIYDNPENRCLVHGYRKNRCICFAPLFYFYDSTLAAHDSSQFYTRHGGVLFDRPSLPTNADDGAKKGCDSNCLFCFEQDNCLVPKRGYNRELSTNEVEHMRKKTTLLSVYEGGAQREGRVRFVNSRGHITWLLCPPGCR